MATKKVQIEIKQGAGFRTECRSGRHTMIIDQPAAAAGWFDTVSSNDTRADDRFAR